MLEGVPSPIGSKSQPPKVECTSARVRGFILHRTQRPVTPLQSKWMVKDTSQPHMYCTLQSVIWMEIQSILLRFNHRDAAVTINQCNRPTSQSELSRQVSVYYRCGGAGGMWCLIGLQPVNHLHCHRHLGKNAKKKKSDWFELGLLCRNRMKSSPSLCLCVVFLRGSSREMTRIHACMSTPDLQSSGNPTEFKRSSQRWQTAAGEGRMVMNNLSDKYFNIALALLKWHQTTQRNNTVLWTCLRFLRMFHLGSERTLQSWLLT